MDGYMILKDKAAEIIIFVVVAMSLSVLLMNAGDMPMGTQEEAWQWMYGCWAVVLVGAHAVWDSGSRVGIGSAMGLASFQSCPFRRDRFVC